LGPGRGDPRAVDAAGFAEVQTVQDLEQRDRITLGRRPA
jgi:release factor glutamine methyltransferase